MSQEYDPKRFEQLLQEQYAQFPALVLPPEFAVLILPILQVQGNSPARVGSLPRYVRPSRRGHHVDCRAAFAVTSAANWPSVIIAMPSISSDSNLTEKVSSTCTA